MSSVSRGIDRIAVTFDEPGLVANAGLLLVATLVKRLDLEALVDTMVRIPSKLGGFSPGRKVLTLVHALVAGASHIDHADVLRAGASEEVLSHRVMAPSTLGTFLRAFTFGYVRQLEAVVGEVLRRAWSAMTLPSHLVGDVDSTICEVAGKKKAGAAYGYTKVLGLHPLLATRADTGEVLHARLRKGSAQHPTRRQALRRRARRPPQESRGDHDARHALRLGVLVEGDPLHLGAPGCVLHHGRAGEHEGDRRSDQRDRRGRLDGHRLSRRR